MLSFSQAGNGTSCEPRDESRWTPWTKPLGYSPVSSLLSFLMTHAMMGPAMAHDGRAVDLEVNKDGEQIEVLLHGHSDRNQRVSFEIEVTGNSNSRHRGSTTLAANSPQVLSTIKLSARGDWCARVTVEEEDRAPYELTEGSC